MSCQSWPLPSQQLPGVLLCGFHTSHWIQAQPILIWPLFNSVKLYFQIRSHFKVLGGSGFLDSGFCYIPFKHAYFCCSRLLTWLRLSSRYAAAETWLLSGSCCFLPRPPCPNPLSNLLRLLLYIHGSVVNHRLGQQLICTFGGNCLFSFQYFTIFLMPFQMFCQRSPLLDASKQQSSTFLSWSHTD